MSALTDSRYRHDTLAQLAKTDPVACAQRIRDLSKRDGNLDPRIAMLRAECVARIAKDETNKSAIARAIGVAPSAINRILALLAPRTAKTAAAVDATGEAVAA